MTDEGIVLFGNKSREIRPSNTDSINKLSEIKKASRDNLDSERMNELYQDSSERKFVSDDSAD